MNFSLICIVECSEVVLLIGSKLARPRVEKVRNKFSLSERTDETHSRDDIEEGEFIGYFSTAFIWSNKYSKEKWCGPSMKTVGNPHANHVMMAAYPQDCFFSFLQVRSTPLCVALCRVRHRQLAMFDCRLGCLPTANQFSAHTEVTNPSLNYAITFNLARRSLG